MPSDPDPQPLFDHVAPASARGPRLYPRHRGRHRRRARFRQGDKPFDYAAFKAAYRDAGGKGAWLVNNGYDKELAEDAVADGSADLVAFGKLFIANPDLAARLKNAELNAPEQATFYGGGAKGYVDYPTAA